LSYSFKHVRKAVYDPLTVLIYHRALLLAFDNGTKATCSGTSISIISQATTALDTLINNIVERVARLNVDKMEIGGDLTIPPFLIFLVYKAAAITTERLQSGIEPEINLQRLKVLRNSLRAISQRWLAGGESFCQVISVIANAF
jgi:hypothetical protein